MSRENRKYAVCNVRTRDGKSANVVTIVHGRGKRFFRRRFGNEDVVVDVDGQVKGDEEDTA